MAVTGFVDIINTAAYMLYILIIMVYKVQFAEIVWNGFFFFILFYYFTSTLKVLGDSELKS